MLKKQPRLCRGERAAPVVVRNVSGFFHWGNVCFGTSLRRLTGLPLRVFQKLHSVPMRTLCKRRLKTSLRLSARSSADNNEVGGQGIDWLVSVCRLTTSAFGHGHLRARRSRITVNVHAGTSRCLLRQAGKK